MILHKRCCLQLVTVQNLTGCHAQKGTIAELPVGTYVLQMGWGHLIAMAYKHGSDGTTSPTLSFFLCSKHCPACLSCQLHVQFSCIREVRLCMQVI
jgi:hypothetical protein